MIIIIVIIIMIIEVIEKGDDMIYIRFEHHGACQVALVALKGHPKRVVHYSKRTGQEDSWAIRDYLADEIIRAAESKLSASDLEKLVEYSEAPAYRSVNNKAKWKADCQAASERHFGAAHVDATSPNPPTLGRWRRLR